MIENLKSGEEVVCLFYTKEINLKPMRIKHLRNYNLESILVDSTGKEYTVARRYFVSAERFNQQNLTTEIIEELVGTGYCNSGCDVCLYKAICNFESFVSNSRCSNTTTTYDDFLVRAWYSKVSEIKRREEY